EDVTLNADGSATGGGVVTIVNGVGTIAISDTVPETVNLTLTDSETTGLDVSSTQDVIFSAGADLTNSSGDDGTNPGGGDNIAGVARNGGGNDSNNLVSGKAKVDVEYDFSILFKDDTGESPKVEPKLFLAHKSIPTEGANGDFFKYDLACTGETWGIGKICSTTLKLGPAAAHKFYFYAKKTDNVTEVRLPASGYTDGPTVQVLTNYEMLSAARDIESENLGGSEAFNSTYTYRWVSFGTDIDFNVEFNGDWELVTPGSPGGPAKAGEGYFVLKNSSTLPELASSSDVTDPTYTYTLQAGWNIISNPYNGNVKLSDIEVQKNSDTPVSWVAATGDPNNWIINGIYFYDGSDWEDTYSLESAGGSPDAELVPWLAYWVYLQVTGDTYKLIIPIPAR
ncbi:MAG: hypothetical protein ACYSTI_12660, partial [Planctomycetota bacterium]